VLNKEPTMVSIPHSEKIPIMKYTKIFDINPWVLSLIFCSIA
jgi:hypothetical protein